MPTSMRVQQWCLVAVLGGLLLLAAPAEGTNKPGSRYSSSYVTSSNKRPGSMSPRYCASQQAGCSKCAWRKVPTAQGAGPADGVTSSTSSVFQCLDCRDPAYKYNRTNLNCDCAPGFGTYLMPGATQEAAAKYITTAAASAAMAASLPAVVPAAPRVARAASKPGAAAAEASDASAATTTDFSSTTTATNMDTSTTTSSSAGSLGPTAGFQAPVLQCLACRGNSVSRGGLLGMAYCQPCPPGMRANPRNTMCVYSKKHPKA